MKTMDMPLNFTLEQKQLVKLVLELEAAKYRPEDALKIVRAVFDNPQLFEGKKMFGAIVFSITQDEYSSLGILNGQSEAKWASSDRRLAADLEDGLTPLGMVLFFKDGTRHASPFPWTIVRCFGTNADPLELIQQYNQELVQMADEVEHDGLSQEWVN